MELDVGTGRTYLTMTLAIAHAVAVPGSYEIVYYNNLTEEVILNGNVNSISSDNGARVWNSTGAATTLTITNGLTQTCTIFGCDLQKTAGNDNTISWTSVGAGSKLIFRNNKLGMLRTAGAQTHCISVTDALTTTDQLTVYANEVTLLANGANGINIGGATTTANTVLVYWNTFIGNTTAGIRGIQTANNNSNAVLRSWGNTFSGFAIGFQSNGKSENWNNLFINNTTDVSLSGSAAKGDFLNCGFQQQTNDGGWNSTIKFGLVSANEIVGGGNYRLLKSAICVGVGKDVGLTGSDYYGAVKLPHHAYDIGGAILVRRRFP